MPLTAEICREGAAPQICSPVAHLQVESDTPTLFHDVLPKELATGPERLLAYRVRILNGAGKGTVAGAVRTLAGAAPPPLLQLQAEPMSRGVALHWQPDPQIADRVLIHVQRGEPNLEKHDSRKGQGEILLAVESTGTDAGGALDPGARIGTAQHYVLARTRTIHMGTEDLTISSAPASVSVSASARPAPPPPPVDLEAVATTLTLPVIELSWSPVPGAATYRVYRAEGSNPRRLLSLGGVSGLSFSDQAVRPNMRYRYSVSAVDAQGIEGAPSPEVTEAIAQP